jgi:hypothetical protein
MLAVQKDGGCHDHPVDIFHGEQSPVSVEGLNAGNHLFRLVAAATLNVGDGNQLRVGKLQNLLEKILGCRGRRPRSYPGARDHWLPTLATESRPVAPLPSLVS